MSIFEDFFVPCSKLNFWRSTYEGLEKIGFEAKLAHPKRTRAIAESEIKTDSIIAQTLDHLLRTVLVHESYVPSGEIALTHEP